MLAQCLITRGDMTAWRGMCGKAELEWEDQWYKHTPEQVVENTSSVGFQCTV